LNERYMICQREKPLKRFPESRTENSTPLKRGVNEILDSDVLKSEAQRRLMAMPGDPFLFADWERVLFLHFLIAPEVLRGHVPPPFELDLYQGQGCISVVAVTMRNFRPCHFDPAAYPFRCIREQRFLNFRTYARWGGEPGAFFIHGWLSRPAGLPVPSNLFGLPYTVANSSYEHVPENGMIRGNVSAGNHEFSYRALVPKGEWRRAETTAIELRRSLENGLLSPALSSKRGEGEDSDGSSEKLHKSMAVPAEAGSVAEFAMERYSGFFCGRDKSYVFRAWHPEWLQQSVEAMIERDDLITTRFPWWKEAQFVGANFAPGFERVELGKAHALASGTSRIDGHRVLSRLFEMP